MNLAPFTGPGSTPSRRRFWDKVTQAVIASQKVAGRNVSISEHQGMGTLINIIRERGGSTGACCDDEGNCTQTTEAGCAGTFRGVGTLCEEDTCFGLCCQPGCTIHSTPAACAEAGGTFQGFGSGPTCDPDPCCSDCGGLVWQGCFDGDTCWTGPELCGGGCGGEEIPCDLAINALWYTDTAYCITCPGDELELHVITHIDPITCEFTQTFYSDCDIGDTHVMSDYFPPCE